MSFKIKLNAKIDRASLQKVFDKKLKLLRDNIRAVVKNEAMPFLIDLIMKGYDDLSDKAEMGPDDPTNPANWRNEFLAKLRQDLVENLIFAGDRILIKIGNKEFLGYDASGLIDPDDARPLHWLVYYIEGLAGDWAFITPEVYQQITGQPYQPGWGRFGEGFMIERGEYSSQGWDRIVPFPEVRHPFSGFSPTDIFEEALNEFKIRPFIQKAITATTRGDKL